MSAALGKSVQVLPTEESLSELLAKLMTIFEVDSFQEGRDLPIYPLQREVSDSTSKYRHILKTISGNDFHVWPTFILTPAWEALLQLKSASGSIICIPLCRINRHPQSEQQAMENVEYAVALLKSSWPDASIGPLRRQLGSGAPNPEPPSHYLFRWLASKELSRPSEGVSLKDLFRSGGQLREQLRPKHKILTVKESIEADWALPSVSSSTSERDGSQAKPADAQIWSFTGARTTADWIISLPIISTILLLTTNPNKKVEVQTDCPDRDLSWCLDSMHGFCRLKGPSESERDLSWSMGTFPDCWMYLHFIFYYFTPGPYESDVDESDKWKGSGLRCERRKITLPIGRDNVMEPFLEERIWFGMRTATAYRGDETYLDHESTIGFILADWAHFPINMKPKSWQKSGLESPDSASGVALFHMLLRNGADHWNWGWHHCLDYIDRLHEIKAEDLESSNVPESMFDPSGNLAKAYFLTANLLKIFRKHLDVLPQALKDMKTVWERTYPAIEPDLIERFDEATQAALLRNWDNVISYADALHAKLAARINTKTKDLMSLRDSLLIARSVGSQTANMYAS